MFFYGGLSHRDPQLRVAENYSILFNLKPKIFKSHVE